MRILSTGATLILILILVLGSETRARTIADWQMFKLDAMELSELLDALHSGDDRVLKLEFTPHRSDGRLEGCGYTFRVFMRDKSTHSDLPFIAHGDIAYFSKKDSAPYLSLAIGLKSIKEHNSRIWERDSAVHYAYLNFGNISLAGKEYSTTSGADEVKTFRYHDSAEAKLMTWLTIPERLSIRINRGKSSAELQFELAVLDFRDAWMDQSDCYRELTQIGR